MEAFFTIRDPILGVDCSLAMITEYPPKAGEVTNPSTGLVMLFRRMLMFSEMQSTPERYIIPVDTILSMVQVVDVPDAQEYLLNTHIDLTVYNQIY